MPDFTRFKSPTKKKVNLLVFGYSGSGKSSTINTLVTACSNDKEKVHKVAEPRPPTKDTGEQWTQTYTCIPLTRYLQIYDTWGFTPENNYTKGEFIQMISGRMVNGRKMNVADTNVNTRPNPENQIDGIIFIFDVSVQAIPQTVKNLQPFFQTAHDLGKPFWVAVTKTDEQDPTLRLADPVILQNASNYQKCMKAIESGLDFPVKIFPIINYKHNDTIRNPKLDTLAGLLLKDILDEVGVVEVAEEEEKRVEGFNYFEGETFLSIQCKMK